MYIYFPKYAKMAWVGDCMREKGKMQKRGRKSLKENFFWENVYPCPKEPFAIQAFFRRAVQSGKDLRYKCKGDGTCPVTVTNRRGCQKCRFVLYVLKVWPFSYHTHYVHIDKTSYTFCIRIRVDFLTDIRYGSNPDF